MDYITANNIITRIGNQMESHKNRPLGVTIIAVLTAIGGIIFLASGAVLLLIGIGIIFLALGVAYLVMAYGLWTGKRWAWTITLILSGIGIILAVISIAAGNIGSIVSIIIHAVVIYYLYRPSVKVYFGK
jgi:uncharacterized membrane protein HdeD (DUF308 family)